MRRQTAYEGISTGRPRTAAVLAAAAFAAISCAPADGDPPAAAATGETPTRGAAAAATASRPVSDARFRSLSGEWASLAEYRGQVVILNLWGTWCVPCRREIPELVEIERAYAGRGVAVIGLAIDSGEPEEIRAFADGYGVRYAIWTTDMATALTEFQAVGYPFTLLIARDGTIRHQFYGPQTLDSLAPEIEALLD